MFRLPIGPLITCIAIAFVCVGVRGQNDQTPTVENKGQPVENNGRPVYRVGGHVIPPRAIYAPDPEYSDEARLAKLQGTCALSVVVGSDGKPYDVRISHSLGMGLDEKSIAAVRRWQFEPGKKDGQPVAVQALIETNFHLYSLPGFPAELHGLPPTGTASFEGPDTHAADYPLLVGIDFVSSKQISARGYLVAAEATFGAGRELSKANIACDPKKCFMLSWGKYPARWLSTNEMELIGRKGSGDKWQKARFLVMPLQQSSQALPSQSPSQHP